MENIQSSKRKLNNNNILNSLISFNPNKIPETEKNRAAGLVLRVG